MLDPWSAKTLDRIAERAPLRGLQDRNMECFCLRSFAPLVPGGDSLRVNLKSIPAPVVDFLQPPEKLTKQSSEFLCQNFHLK